MPGLEFIQDDIVRGNGPRAVFDTSLCWKRELASLIALLACSAVGASLQTA